MTDPAFNFPITINQVLAIIQHVAVPLLGYIAYTMQDIRKELRKINNRVVKCETWAMEHEKWAESQVVSLRRDIDRIDHASSEKV